MRHDCVGFRLLKIHSVYRIKPATVSIRSFNVEEWTCPRQYNSGTSLDSTPFFCTGQDHNQPRGCRCIRGTCASCGITDNVRSHLIQHSAFASEYVFKLRALYTREESSYGMRHLVFSLQSQLKNCAGQLNGSEVTFVTKKECLCPVFAEGAEYWIMGKRYYEHMNEDGETRLGFFLDNESFLLFSERSENFERDSSAINNAIESVHSSCQSRDDD